MEQPTVRIEFFGISPWEIEVAHGYFGAMFALAESQTEQPDPDTTSYMRIRLPVSFSDEFFEWFGFKRWEKVLLLLKEMKRRRGARPGSLLVRLDFEADPQVSFVIDSQERSGFDNSVEKMDYVLEVIDRHREQLPSGPLVYRFNARTRRWSADGSQGPDRGAETRKTI